MTQIERAKLRKEQTKQAKILYKDGASVRDVAASLQVSYGKAHRLLEDAKVKMRPRGGRRTPATIK